MVSGKPAFHKALVINLHLFQLSRGPPKCLFSLLFVYMREGVVAHSVKLVELLNVKFWGAHRNLATFEAFFFDQLEQAFV
jgi:hypothetical protein